MDLFHIIDDGVCILRIKGGRFKQTKIFRLGENVYAEIGSSFVRLLRGGGTTDPRISWQGVEGPGVTIDQTLPKWSQPPASTKAPAKTKTKLKVVG